MNSQNILSRKLKDYMSENNLQQKDILEQLKMRGVDTSATAISYWIKSET